MKNKYELWADKKGITNNKDYNMHLEDEIGYECICEELNKLVDIINNQEKAIHNLKRKMEYYKSSLILLENKK